ncbi:MAG: T9SS type A sorting domain-containing protein [Salinivirgaceae bacterium]|jgi:hypothetical protein|nr:T9SS type A sorting domain-containing protein [Salinivirgaceae bacterium]
MRKITSSQINEYISIAGPNTSIWSVPKANMHNAIWPVLKNVNWSAYAYNKSGEEDNTSFESNSESIVYPNPARDMLHIELPQNQSESIEIAIYDALGRQVLKEPLQNNSVNIQNIDNGIYILHICVEHKTETRKIIIDK